MTELEKEYRARFDTVLKPLAKAIELQLLDYLQGIPHIDRVVARPKAIDRFVKKANKTNNDGTKKYEQPLIEIQDQVGARVIVHYLSDVKPVTERVQKYLTEIESKVMAPKSSWSFGYFGHHFIADTPPHLIDSAWHAEMVPEFFELQIKTLFQHAWSEAGHDLGYKPELALDEDSERRLAFTAAQSWGADRIFDELLQEQQQKLYNDLNGIGDV